MMKLDYVEFYITNVCNLNCPRCNRFNNYAFSGHLDWRPHQEVYEQWSRRLEVDRIGILGGEPMLHPDFQGWVDFAARLWPNSQIMVYTNGTQLSRHPDLYQWLAQHRGRVRLDINRHDASARDQTLSNIERLYPNGFEKYLLTSPEQHDMTGQHGRFEWHYDSQVKGDIDPGQIGPEIWQDKSYEVVYRDRSLVTIRYANADSFDESVVRLDPDSMSLSLTSYLSDADLAAEVCRCKFSHHFFQGRLYKCGITAILPEFMQQFPVKISDQKRSLLSSYRAAEVSWSEQDLQTFLHDLSSGQAISQCALCPESFQSEPFAAGTKKIKIQKLKQGIQ